MEIRKWKRIYFRNKLFITLSLLSKTFSISNSIIEEINKGQYPFDSLDIHHRMLIDEMKL